MSKKKLTEGQNSFYFGHDFWTSMWRGVQSQTQANEAAGVEFAWVPGKGRGRQDTGAVVSPKEARDETLNVGDWGTDLKEWAH